MIKEISSDVNFIVALTNELDELYSSSNMLLGQISKDYEGYLLLIRAKKHFLDTYTLKIFDAFTIINRAIIKVTSRVRTNNEKITTIEMSERVEKEVQEAIRNNLANRNFINLILKEYTIITLLDIHKRKEALERFQANDKIAEEMLKKFEDIIRQTKMKFFDGGPPRLRPGNKFVIIKENMLKEYQQKNNLFRNNKNKPDMEDLAISAEYLCHTDYNKNRQVDFITTDGPLSKSLLYIREIISSVFNIWFIDRNGSIKK